MADLETPVTLTPGSQSDFKVTFNPDKPKQETEKRYSRLQITNSDSDENPYKIDLYGWVEYDD
jgi:hypothetical protein